MLYNAVNRTKVQHLELAKMGSNSNQMSIINALALSVDSGLLFISNEW